MTDDYWICADHIVMYINTESLHCPLKTDRLVRQLYFIFKNKLISFLKSLNQMSNEKTAHSSNCGIRRQVTMEIVWVVVLSSICPKATVWASLNRSRVVLPKALWRWGLHHQYLPGGWKGSSAYYIYARSYPSLPCIYFPDILSHMSSLHFTYVFWKLRSFSIY